MIVIMRYGIIYIRSATCRGNWKACPGVISSSGIVNSQRKKIMIELDAVNALDLKSIPFGDHMVIIEHRHTSRRSFPTSIRDTESLGNLTLDKVRGTLESLVAVFLVDGGVMFLGDHAALEDERH